MRAPWASRILDDVAPAHVRGAAEAGLPVAAAPVHRRVEQRRLLLEQLLHHVELGVGVDDEVLHEHAVDLRLLPRRLERRRRVVALERGLDRAGGGRRRAVLRLVLGRREIGRARGRGADHDARGQGAERSA